MVLSMQRAPMTTATREVAQRHAVAMRHLVDLYSRGGLAWILPLALDLGGDVVFDLAANFLAAGLVLAHVRREPDGAAGDQSSACPSSFCNWSSNMMMLFFSRLDLGLDRRRRPGTRSAEQHQLVARPFSPRRRQAVFSSRTPCWLSSARPGSSARARRQSSRSSSANCGGSTIVRRISLEHEGVGRPTLDDDVVKPLVLDETILISPAATPATPSIPRIFACHVLGHASHHGIEHAGPSDDQVDVARWYMLKNDFLNPSAIPTRETTAPPPPPCRSPSVPNAPGGGRRFFNTN